MGDQCIRSIEYLGKLLTTRTRVRPSSTVQKSRFSSQTRIQSILSRPDGGAGLAGEKVQISGWVKTGREQGKGTFAFLEVNDGSCAANLQVMVNASSLSDHHHLSKLVATGTSLTVDGFLKIPPQGKCTMQKIELKAEKVFDVGMVDSATYPIPKTKLSLEHLRDYTHLRARTTIIAGVTRIRSKLTLVIHLFCDERNITHVHTPIITTSNCEGGAEMFQVKNSQDFFGRQANLTVSGQLHLEACACSMGNVYAFGPTFRAENSNTSRHLAEFWMFEVELAFAGLEEAMNCAEELVKYLCNSLLENCYDDMELMAKNIDETCIERLKLAASIPFGRVTYTEAIKLLEEAVAQGKEFENQVKWGIDLASEHERYLTEVLFQKPLIVYNYPKEIKAFYMRLNDDGKTVAAFDVLVPKVGELIGGSQREEREDVLIERMEEKGLPIKENERYIDLRRYGTVKHSGFGMGLERMLLFATGMDNIRDVIPSLSWKSRFLITITEQANVIPNQSTKSQMRDVRSGLVLFVLFQFIKETWSVCISWSGLENRYHKVSISPIK